MVFEPRDFLDLANQIYVDKSYNHEAAWRTVISRAYYASFLAAFKQLSDHKVRFQDSDRIHRDVIEAVIRMNSGIGNWLETLRSARVDADYKVMANIQRGNCQNLLKLAEYALRDMHLVQ